jgi:CBS domain-containing protein
MHGEGWNAREDGTLKHRKSWEVLGDFTATARLLPISALALGIGAAAAFVIRERMDAEGESVLDRGLSELVRLDAVPAFPDEPLRVVVYRMAEKGFTRMPVVERDTGKFLGLVSLDDLLKARSRHLEEERRRERPLKLRFLLPGRKVSPETEIHTAR